MYRFWRVSNSQQQLAKTEDWNGCIVGQETCRFKSTARGQNAGTVKWILAALASAMGGFDTFSDWGQQKNFTGTSDLTVKQ